MIKNSLMEIRLHEYHENPRDFARRINVNQMTYYRWESGESRPSLAKALQVAKILGKQLEEIWYLDE